MKYQYLAALSANLLTLIYGISAGWAAPNILLFQSDKSPIGQLSMEEISPIASLLCAGGVLGTIIFGWWTDKLGRKSLLLLMTVPEIISFALILLGDHHYYIYASRILGGIFGGGVFVIIPIFVTEIADARIRGALGSFLVLFMNLGILLGFTLSSFFKYYVNIYVNLGNILVFLCIFLIFPESPEFLILKKKEKCAEKSFKFYNGISKKESLPPDLQHKFDQMKNFVEKQNETQKSKLEMLMEFKEKIVYLGFTYSMIVIAFADLCGTFTIMSYLTLIFERASIDIDIYLSTIIVGVIQILGSCLALVLVDRFGRRILFIVSALGTGVLIMICGIYYYLLLIPSWTDFCTQFKWVPLATLSCYVLMCNVGITTLPFFIISELLPVQLRGIVGTVALALSWLLAFAMLQCYPFFMSLIGIHGTMFLFASFCFIEIAFIYFFLPETKGISFQEIQSKLSQKKL